jgi:hypothetical protein
MIGIGIGIGDGGAVYGWMSGGFGIAMARFLHKSLYTR